MASSNYTLSISAASTKKDAAAAFLEWMAEDAQQQPTTSCRVNSPSRRTRPGLTGTIYEPVVALLESESYTSLPSNVWPNPSIYDALGVGAQGLLTGQKTIDQLLGELDAAWDQ